MIIAIFAKRRQTNDGKTFFNYLSTLHGKDGNDIPVQVKFRESAGAPKPEECPINIIVDKADANLSKREYIDETTAETRVARTLWVTKWAKGEPYVDHSLDDFD